MLPSLRFPTLLGACCGLLVTAVPAPAQFNTPTVNGTPDNPAGEYGSNVPGENYVLATTDQGWFVTWDADYLYIGISQANLAEGAVIYVDWNPIVPVTGGTNADGSVEGQEYDGLRFARLPFRADFVAYFKSGYHEFRQANGANGWGGNVANTWLYAENGGNNSREVRIPWDDITAGNGRPASFNWFGYLTGASAQVYGSVPTARDPFSGGTFARDPWYLTVDSTADGSSTFPFQLNSYTYVENFNNVLGQPLLTHGTFADLTVNRPNIQLMRSEDPVFTQLRDLIVGDGEFHFGTSPSFLEVTRDVHLVGGKLTLGTQAGGDLRVGRDFRISPGAVFQGNDRQVDFTGQQTAVIEGDFTGSNHIDYMRVDKFGGGSLTMNGNVDVIARLWLSSGVLDSNGNTLQVLYGNPDTMDNGVRREGTDTGYVRGTLHRRIGLTQGIRQFPVGTNPAAPLFIDFGQSGPSQIGAIAVSTTEQIVAPLDADNMIARTWQVDIVQPLGTYEAALEFQYDAGDIDGAVVEADLRAAKRYSAGSFHAHASTWLDPQSAVETDGFSVNDTSNNQSLEGLWVLTTAPDSLLRVELVGFAAVCDGVGSPVTIEWETAAEFMNAGFNVYRAEAGNSHRKLNAFPIPARGSETQGAQYAFVDAEVMRSGEQRAYMLEDVEFSGTRKLHGPVAVGPLQAASSDVADWSLYAW